MSNEPETRGTKRVTYRGVTGRRGLRIAAGLAAVSAGWLTGCADVFNASFLSLISTPTPNEQGQVPDITLDNAPGHVAIVLINNMQFEQRLLDYLATTGADLGDPNGPPPIPRVRARFQLTYMNGNTNTIEFISGSTVVEGTALAGGGLSVPPELNEFPLTNFVAVCDIALIEPVQVEVFVPVTTTSVGLVETQNTVERVVAARTPPSFVPLQPDTVNTDNNAVVIRNYDIRKAPVPVTGVQCGGVVGFTVAGTLEMSFTAILGQIVPGFLETDTVTQAANPGRFEFTTSIR
jgi:hypothetical protein